MTRRDEILAEFQDDFSRSSEGRAYLVEQAEKLEARAKAAGLTTAELQAADEFGMSPTRYIAMRDGRSIVDFERMRETETLEAEARRELEKERLLEKLRKGK